VKRLAHGRVALALHPQGPAVGGPALLCVHALGGSAADWAPRAGAWPGPVFAVDLAGHGHSGWVRGGAYTPELFAGDVDCALAELGEAFLCGSGLGAWVALLVAAARRDAVPGSLLLPGPGLAGGGEAPDPSRPGEPFLPDGQAERPPAGAALDPLTAVADRDWRPADYAHELSADLGGLHLAAVEPPPPWWAAAREAARSPVEVPAEPAAAIAALAASAGA